jgi:hypothetical protein
MLKFAQTDYMKSPVKVLVLAGVAIAIIGIATYTRRRRNTNNMLDQVADEGYETAFDVLFGDKKNRRKKLHYGPVLRA